MVRAISLGSWRHGCFALAGPARALLALSHGHAYLVVVLADDWHLSDLAGLMSSCLEVARRFAWGTLTHMG